MAEGDLRDWTKGNRLSAAHLQEPINILRKFLAMPNAGIGQEGSGYARPVYDLFIGKITDTGPGTESDYTDERYWVKPQYIIGTSLTSDQITTDDIPAPEVPSNPGESATVDDTLTVTNLAEIANHSHLLQIDQLVLYIGVYDWQTTSKLHHVMSETVVVVLTPVALTQTGGAIGTQSTASSWTYTVKTIDSVTTLLTGASPMVSRPNGRLTAASYGTGYYAADGSGFVLFKAEEIEDTGGC